MKGKEGCILKSFTYTLFIRKKKASGFSTVVNLGKRMGCKLPLTSLWGLLLCPKGAPVCVHSSPSLAPHFNHSIITQPVKALSTSPNATLPGPQLSLSLLITNPGFSEPDHHQVDTILGEHSTDPGATTDTCGTDDG